MIKQKLEIPDYINCKTNKDVCEWYMHEDCENRCPYCLDINGIGVGAIDRVTTKSMLDKMFIEDMRDF